MLVYSNTKANDEVGLYYYDPATETPEQATRIKLIENIQNGLSPYFMQMVDDGQWDVPSTTGGFHVWANGVQKIKNNMFAVKMVPTPRPKMSRSMCIARIPGWSLRLQRVGLPVRLLYLPTSYGPMSVSASRLFILTSPDMP